MPLLIKHQLLALLSDTVVFIAVVIAIKITWKQAFYKEFVTSSDLFFWLCLLLSEPLFRFVMMAAKIKLSSEKDVDSRGLRRLHGPNRSKIEITCTLQWRRA